MEPLSRHLLLVNGTSLENAVAQVRDFFENTLLLRYEKFAIMEDECCCATTENFFTTLQQGLNDNRDRLARFVEEFKATGFSTVEDLNSVEHGYPSKLLHIITHFIDGFIGIDTIFYNLIDDSHWVPPSTEQAIEKNPEGYWLIPLEGYSESPETAGLINH